MKKIVLFGDSLFNGFRNRRNTNLITKGLENRLSNAQVENFSKSGATTVEALDYIDQIPQDADAILIEYGTNDSSAWGISCTNYAKNLETMIAYFNTKKVIVVGPWHPNPNSDQSNFFNPETLKTNIQTAKNLAIKYHCPFIDLTKLTNNQKDMDKIYQNDGLHLTDLGNNLLLDALTPIIESKIRD
ncbi:SGNH/GDSL hydrolase family protein [Lactobacillus hamsteri]|uniref:Arylesterase n=1 Tax=Lactobacillus hamsteri DSM 5661 = JCM 6256 TaxID=1423754 RepID=A0A0R1YEE2_9LACO|nr:SGNH/GDSL hydrolase family protein [Lactobacillus hamsteri]KRM40846.1 arylesterase [Lactobacillus hamsteri DSM 5661 = JCM 6256]